MHFFQKSDSWKGTPTAAFKFFHNHLGDEQLRYGKWPANAQQFGKQLSLITPALTHVGIDVDRDDAGTGSEKTRMIRMRRYGTNGTGATHTEENGTYGAPE